MESTSSMHHPMVELEKGMVYIEYYDLWVKWIFDNEPFMELMRWTFIIVNYVVIPLLGYGAYRLYWYLLEKNIWVPNVA